MRRHKGGFSVRVETQQEGQRVFTAAGPAFTEKDRESAFQSRSSGGAFRSAVHKKLSRKIEGFPVHLWQCPLIPFPFLQRSNKMGGEKVFLQRGVGEAETVAIPAGNESGSAKVLQQFIALFHFLERVSIQHAECGIGDDGFLQPLAEALCG